MAHPVSILLLFAVLPVQAGEFFLDSRVSSDFQELQSGLRLGGEGSPGIGKVRVSAFLDAEFRPFPRGTRVEILGEEMRDIPEGGYFLGPGIGAAYPLNPIMFLAVCAGMASAYASPELEQAGWTGWTEVSLRIPVGEFCHIEAGWQYRPVPDIADHRALLQFRFRPT